MSAVALEFEYLIRRARKQKDHALAELLTQAYNKYLDSVTS